jgi:hypothetical protein
MAKRKVEDEGPMTDENQRPQEYDEEAMRAREEAIARQQAGDPRYKPVPEGDIFAGTDPLEDRAAEAKRLQKEAPVLDHSGGQPSPVEVIAARQQNRQRLEEMPTQIDPDDPFLEPRTQQTPLPEENKHTIMVTIFYGGRFRLLGFSSFDYMRGYVQQEKGTKRIFRYTGNTEWQEIRATGESIIR